MNKVKARKKYKCDITGKDINIGDMYIRVNVRNVGIYHFHKMMGEHEIKNHIYPDIFYNSTKKERNNMCHPTNYDSFEKEIWDNMPEEF